MSDERRPSRGRLEAIWIKRARRGPMDPVQEARIVAGRGLVGNANQGGRRQVALISAEAWRAVQEELGETVEPSVRRANLLIWGLDLEATRDRTLCVGGVRLRVRGETVPCGRMDEAHPGLRRALRSACRGGVFCEALDDGVIRVGQPVVWEE